MRKSYLPSASQPWGADIERILQQIEKRVGSLEWSTSTTENSLAQVMPTIGSVNVVSEVANEASNSAQTAIVMADDAASTADGAVTWSENDPQNPPGTEDNPVFPPANSNALWYTVDGDGTVVKTWQWEPSSMDPKDPDYVAGSWVQQKWGETALSPGSVSASILAQSVSDDINTAKSGAAAAQTAANTANQAAANAQTAANTANDAAAAAAGVAAGKGKIIYATSAPTGDDRNANNLWINTAGAANTPMRWDGTNWVAVSDKNAVDAASAAAAAQSAADQAVSAAQDAADVAAAAGLAANNAQTTADGKNTVYYQTAEPAGADLNLKANDVWYDADDGYKMYRYSGTAWVAATYGASALSDDINDSINTAINDSGTAKQVSEQAAIDASSAVVLRVDSTRGLVFKNSLISTVLTVTVFGKGKTITDIIDLHDAFGLGAYLEWSWRRIDDTDFGIISSADSRLSEGGFKLTVSPEDVDTKTVFMCSLNV